ncbi:MAG: hypothetical protein HZA51_04300 [Planctomycetes bacterium]|nr:hypothetical protein [Planctomycetota bacterium]
MATKSKTIGGISDEAVIKATGKSWAQWIALLNKAGCKTMTHKEIVAVVHTKHGVGPWWQQMVTVGYEQAVGLRKKHETPKGFQVGRSKTVAVPTATLFRAWADAKTRATWLKATGFTIRKATRNKSIRISWKDGTNVEIMFYSKGAGKCMVTVQHNKLRTAAAGAAMKRFWGEQLERMQRVLSLES